MCFPRPPGDPNQSALRIVKSCTMPPSVAPLSHRLVWQQLLKGGFGHRSAFVIMYYTSAIHDTKQQLHHRCGHTRNAAVLQSRLRQSPRRVLSGCLYDKPTRRPALLLLPTHPPPPPSVIEERLFTTCESTSIDYCREREAFGHPMLCLRLLSLHNALRRTALRQGCEIVSGVACKGVYPASGTDGSKRSVLILGDEGGEEETVTADFVVGADGLKSVVRKTVGGGSGAVMLVTLLSHFIL